MEKHDFDRGYAVVKDPNYKRPRSPLYWLGIAGALAFAIWVLPGVVGHAAGTATGAFMKARAEAFHAR